MPIVLGCPVPGYHRSWYKSSSMRIHPAEEECGEEVKGDRTERRRHPVCDWLWFVLRGCSSSLKFWRLWCPQEESSSSSFTLGVPGNARPDHLIIFVNGINGSASDWRFAAEQFKKKFADKVVVHCSSENSSTRTFDGIDIMGSRLADEVRESVKKVKPLGVTKISFVGHSLGGLIARYAIAELMYLEPGGSGSQQISTSCSTYLPGTIEGLEPVNFITIATPHLGSKGKQYLPFLFGITPLEKVAPFVAHWFVGETGRHLFLADTHKAQEPLLLRMVEDGVKLKFISALQSFKQRTVYANVCHDHMVGWHTASIERGREARPKACKAFQRSENEYPHILKVVNLSAEADNGAKSKCAEDRMVSGLRQVQWRRVDVSFMNANFKYLAHNTIQVKWHFLHREGADVIHHICDMHF